MTVDFKKHPAGTLMTLIIPVVGHVNSGAGPFQSDARLTNAGPLPLLYQLTFTPTRIDGTTDGRVTQVAVSPGQTIALNDIANDFFGWVLKLRVPVAEGVQLAAK